MSHVRCELQRIHPRKHLMQFMRPTLAPEVMTCAEVERLDDGTTVLIAGEISRWDGISNTIVSEVRALRSGVRMPEAHNWR